MRTIETWLGVLVLFCILWISVCWVVNFYKLTQCDFDAPYKCEIMHGIGLFPIAAPLTALLSSDQTGK